MLPSYLSRFLLYILGWEFEDKERIQFETKRLIILFPHTSQWDGFIGALFRTAYLYHRNVRFLIWHDHYKKYGPGLLSKMGFIPVDSDSTKGNTRYIADELNKLDEFIFLISPEGTIKKTDKWKKGFYYIAKETNAYITVLNLDFYKQRIYYHDPWLPSDDLQTELEKIKGLFAKHPPLYPKETNYAEHFKDIQKQLKPFQTERLIIATTLFFLVIQIGRKVIRGDGLGLLYKLLC